MTKHTIELFILAAAAWPLIKVCISPPFWRTFPRLGVKAVCLLDAYAVFLAGIALFFTQLLLPLAVIAAGVLLTLGWRALPGYGRNRGLPPGKLTLLPLGPWFDEQFFLEQAARYGPVFKTSYFFQPMACIVGLPIGLDLLRRFDGNLGTPPLPFSRFIPGGYLRWMAPDKHQHYKQIFRAVFAPEVVRDSEPFFQTEVRDGLRRLAEACANQNHAVGIPPKPYLSRMLFAMWVRLFTGITPDSGEADQLLQCFLIIDMRNPMRASDKAINRALDDIAAIMHRQMDTFAQLEQQGGTAPPCFLAQLQRACPETERNQTVIRNLIYFLHVTWSDVAGLLFWILKMLSDHPEWLARVRDSAPGVDSENNLPERIVMETLRLEQSEHLYRRALQDIRFDSFLIPKGWIVRICVRESHQNPGVFAEPGNFNPDRFLNRRYKETEYSPFGAYRLACLGQFLTKTVGKIFVDVLAREYEIRVTADGPREFGSWRHWRPSTKFRVNVKPIP